MKTFLRAKKAVFPDHAFYTDYEYTYEPQI